MNGKCAVMYRGSVDKTPCILDIVISLILVIGFAFRLLNQKKEFAIHILQNTGWSPESV